jgi:hypothetical protein
MPGRMILLHQLGRQKLSVNLRQHPLGHIVGSGHDAGGPIDKPRRLLMRHSRKCTGM